MLVHGYDKIDDSLIYGTLKRPCQFFVTKWLFLCSVQLLH
ncbi:MAG: hypothetical protein H8D96_08285 [Desulfobacterales bacterium]|uniref:Uncharacterized protein n=1 Tax=Candidatus Desulfatibia vada TaxID=2841696 RepID=A0A8J6NYP0_9BACT|nr:hypothetical protein [Candidatus Desulfatibia vada]